MKKEPMYKRYANQEPIGSVCLNSVFGVLIYEPDETDKYTCDCVCSWCNDEREWCFHRHTVHYTPSGRPFIRKGSLRIYIDEVMRNV